MAIRENDPTIYTIGNKIEAKFYHRMKVWLENGTRS
jgi:hypothetical protein